MGKDFDAYHHHCQRIYCYSKTLLLMRENKKLAIAAAFHDLSIWKDNSMDYLKGSSEECLKYLQIHQSNYLPDEFRHIICHHHQLRSIKGNIEAEAFRKSDLIDLTAGFVRFNIPKSLVQAAEEEFPRLGFSKIILKKWMGYALKNPSKPIPMIKW